MTPKELFEQAMSIFEQIVDLPPEDQPLALVKACRGNETLQREVKALLKSDQEGEHLTNAVHQQLMEVVENVSDPVVSIQVGQVLKDRYWIEKELAVGGIGRVFVARDQLLHQRQVVIKVLLDTALQDPWLLKKFLHESEALAAIDHPGVVKIYDRGQVNQIPFLVMEFIEGESLGNRLRKGALSFGQIRTYLGQICSALNAVHTQGIIHRDLKPDNILIKHNQDGTEHAILIDFGIARLTNPLSSSRTAIPRPAGTLPYMSAEILEDGEATVASDIYALGVMTYEMITMQRPFNVKNKNQFAALFQLVEQQKKADYIAPRVLCPDLSFEAEQVIRKAMLYPPSARYQDVFEFGQAITNALPVDPVPIPASQDSRFNDSQMTTQPDYLLMGNPSLSLATTVSLPDKVRQKDLLPLPVSAIPTQAAVKKTGSLWKLGGAFAAIGILSIVGTVIYNPTQVPLPSVPPKPQTTAPTNLASPMPQISIETQVINQGITRTIPAGTELVKCRKHDQLRFSILLEQAGYVYVLSESPRLDSNLHRRFTILYPGEQENQGSAFHLKGKTIVLPPFNEPGLSFEGAQGTEKVWIIWSLESVPVLETLRTFANARFRGSIHQTNHLTAVSKLLDTPPPNLIPKLIKFESINET